MMLLVLLAISSAGLSGYYYSKYRETNSRLDRLDADIAEIKENVRKSARNNDFDAEDSLDDLKNSVDELNNKVDSIGNDVDDIQSDVSSIQLKIGY